MATLAGHEGYIFGYHAGGRDLHYVLPEATDPGNSVGVVKRDQGIRVPVCHVCTDVELVVEARGGSAKQRNRHPRELSCGKVWPNQTPLLRWRQ